MSYPEALMTRVNPPHSTLRCELLERTHAADEPEWSAIADLLRKTFHGDNCCIVLHRKGGSHEILGYAGLSKEWIALYEERFAALNPYLGEAERRRPENGYALVSTADHLIPQSQARKTEFVKSFLTPLNVNDSVGALLFDGERSIGHVIVRRRSGVLRYGEAEEARMRSIADILASALVRCSRFRDAKARLMALDEIASRSHGGLVMYDERGKVLEVEGSGSAVMEHYAPQLSAALARYLAHPASARGRLESSKPTSSGRDLEYEFRKVTIEGKLRVLCVLGPQAPSNHDAALLPLNAHFTPRERDVLQLLAKGLDNLSIARSLGIGLYTTKDHVKSIFRKLSVKTRAEAVAVLSRAIAPN